MSRYLFVVFVIAVAASACGEVAPVVSGTPPSTSTTTSTTPVPPDDTLGGFGSPSQTAGEFVFDGDPLPVGGTLRLADDGCWYVEFEFASHLAVFPVGFEIPFDIDPTIVVAPDATEFTSGMAIDGRAHEVPFDRVPGGTAGRWGNYVAFCNPQERSLAVFDSIVPAFDPTTLEVDQLEALVTGASFTKSWKCGRGWAASTDDEYVGIFIYQQNEDSLAPGTMVELPSPEWTAEVIVGAHLFTNHCDDVFEPWEPTVTIGARWPVTDGILTILDPLPVGTDSGLVRARLSGAAVTTDTGRAIALEPIDLTNESFNFLAG